MPRDATRCRVQRYELRDRASLERLLDHELPAGWTDVQASGQIFRDIYFDTPAGDLKEKNATVAVRLNEDGSATVRLDLIERRPPGGPPQRRTAHAVVPEADPANVFTRRNDASRLLQALLDPSRLRPVLEVECLRRTRVTRNAAGDTIVLHADIVTVRRGERSADLLEVEIELPEADSPAVDTLLDRLRARFDLRPSLGEREGRIHELAEQLETGALVADIRASREVAVLVHDRGSIAFLSRDDRLVLPGGPGAGATACRQAMRAHLGHARARVRLLGTSPGATGRPALEVWLAEDVSIAPETRVTWLGTDQAIARAGSPGLRDPRTLRALHVAARAGLGSLRRRRLPGRTAPVPGTDPLETVLRNLESAETTPEPSPDEVPPHLLLNMEISRMAFDERVLVMAEDPDTPLLERVRFLAMFGERRDDFFTTRVARFKRLLAAGVQDRSLDGLTPAEQLDLIAIRAHPLMRRAHALFGRRLIPDLIDNGIHIESWDRLSEADRAYVRDTYGERLRALVVPIVADPMHPFPHVRNLRPAVAATVRLGADGSDEFIAVELPGDLPRFMRLPGELRFVPLEDVVKAMLHELYPGLVVIRAHAFRVTRSAQIDLTDEPLDVLESVAEEVARRPFQEVVRLEVEKSMPAAMRLHLLRELQFENEEFASILDEQDVYGVGRIVDLAALHEIADLELPELHFPPTPVRDPFPRGRDVFSLITERERLVRFPEDSFHASVERLLDEAADDPHVAAIKITLYRTSRDSAVIAALKRARQNGKDVVAMVELKASFDEQRNIEWARSLEQAGIRIAFSPPRLKVHAKIALVVRQRGDELERYAYIGTGNLNAATAASYVDVGIFTADRVLTREVNAVFNLLTGYAPDADIEHLLVSPFNMRRRFLRLIDREADHARAGRPARIRMQVNGLADRRIIAALYNASRAGVRIDMMVREICAVRPGVPDVSENIRVTSLLGRWLQHARIFHFHNGGEDEYYIGSADLRPRNMRERVEVVTPVRDPEHQACLDRLLEETLNHPDTWSLGPDGAYTREDQVVSRS